MYMIFRQGHAGHAWLVTTAAAPSLLLNHHSVPIRVLKHPTKAPPVRIEGFNHLESRLQHGSAPFIPLLGFREIEDEKIFRRRRGINGMIAAVRKLEVEVHASVSEHDSIKAVVIFEATDFLQTETVPVHRDGEGEVADGASYAEMSGHASLGRGLLLSVLIVSLGSNLPVCPIEGAHLDGR